MLLTKHSHCPCSDRYLMLKVFIWEGLAAVLLWTSVNLPQIEEAVPRGGVQRIQAGAERVASLQVWGSRSQQEENLCDTSFIFKSHDEVWWACSGTESNISIIPSPGPTTYSWGRKSRGPNYSFLSCFLHFVPPWVNANEKHPLKRSKDGSSEL